MREIRSLPIGSIVYDPSWLWVHKDGSDYSGDGICKPVDWIIVAKNHKGYPINSVTLLTDDLIGKCSFDDESIFTNAFSDHFKDILLETTHESGVTKQVFLPSECELGGEFSHGDGFDWGYFKDNDSRISEICSKSWHYKTRSELNGFGEFARCVNSNGTFGFVNHIYSFSNGIRPVVNISDNTLVKKVTDDFGVVKYEIVCLNLKVEDYCKESTDRNIGLEINVQKGLYDITDVSMISDDSDTVMFKIGDGRYRAIIIDNGTYTFRVTDISGCTVERSITIDNIHRYAYSVD